MAETKAEASSITDLETQDRQFKKRRIAMLTLHVLGFEVDNKCRSYHSFATNHIKLSINAKIQKFIALQKTTENFCFVHIVAPCRCKWFD